MDGLQDAMSIAVDASNTLSCGSTPCKKYYPAGPSTGNNVNGLLCQSLPTLV